MNDEGRIASIRQRLLNLSRAGGETFEYVLARYGIERVLYRLGKSGLTEQFVLKGATLFQVWNKHLHRPTRDLDLLGFGPNDPEALRGVMLTIMRVPCMEDGLTMDEGSLVVAPIREEVEYGGVRAKFRARLGNIRIPVQIDVGFGDAITPCPERREYPTLLDDMPGVTLNTYPTCTVIAEKFEALVRLDEHNSRMKDFFDLDFLLADEAEDRGTLDDAICATFKRRGTELPTDVPYGLTPAFAREKHAMWNAFLRKNGLEAAGFEGVVGRIRDSLGWIWDK